MLILIASIIASLLYGDWTWFQRSGSLMVLIGVVLGGQNGIRRGFEGLIHDKFHIDYGHTVPTPDEIETDWQTKVDILAAQIGIGLAVPGTIIWGYGDLLARLVVPY